MVSMGRLLQALGLQAITLAEEPVGNYDSNVMPPPRSDRTLTPDKALALPAVYRSVQVIAGVGSQLAIHSWRNAQKIDPTPSLVAQPDPWRSRSSWLERILVGMALDGNAFLLKHRAPDRTVAAMEVANPRQTFIRRDSRTGRKSYDVVGFNGTVRNWPAEDVEHIWALEVPGHERGLGPVQACRYALTGILDVRDYADGWFGDTAQDVPSGILKTDQRLDPEAAKFYKDSWRNPDKDTPVAERRRGPQVRVLGQGLTYDPMRLSPSDAQWLESQAFGILDVARMFGVPGDYLLAAVEGSSLTYQNLEMVDAQFLRTTLFPAYLRKIEAALTNVLPRGQEARFDASALLRPDAKTRAEIDAIYIPLGVTTKEQVAQREGTTPGPATPAPTKSGAPA